MKKLYLICLISLAIAIGCKSKKPAVAESKFSVFPLTEVNTAQKNKAYEIGKRVLNTCNTSRFKPFTSSEATVDVIKNTTKERLTKTCQKFRIKYGKFEDIRLVEVLQNKNEGLLVYRYKADYQWKHTQKELRVYMNAENKVTSIKSRDWKDEFQP